MKKEDIKGKEIICKDFELENDEICEIETKREFGNEKGKLVIQPLGVIVMEFLEKHFNDLFDYDYTSKMEESLDKIAKNEQIWFELCKKCNDEIDLLLEKIKVRYHNGELANFGVFNYSFVIEFTLQMPQMLRKSTTIQYPQIISR